MGRWDAKCETPSAKERGTRGRDLSVTGIIFEVLDVDVTSLLVEVMSHNAIKIENRWSMWWMMDVNRRQTKQYHKYQKRDYLQSFW